MNRETESHERAVGLTDESHNSKNISLSQSAALKLSDDNAKTKVKLHIELLSQGRKLPRAHVKWSMA